MTKHPGLLPGDAYLAQLLGWSEDQLLRYQLERQQAAAREWEQKPPIATCDPGTLAIASLATSVLSVGYTILSAVLAPRPREPGQVSSNQRQGDNITDGARYAPRPGFDSSQEVAKLGSVIPITFARREFLPALNGRPAGWYGGCRVDLGLVWSQLVPVDGSQLFRGVYVLGEGPMAEIDPSGFAIGNNPLRSYDLGTDGANEAAARMTLYVRLSGGRLRSSDRIAGRLANNDIGNMENAGADDVFQVRSLGGVIRPDACAAARPSSSTACGLFATLGNGLGLRVNPQLRPTRQMNLRPIGNTGNQLIDPVDDPVALGAIWKARRMWSGRSGIISTSTGVNGGAAYLNVGDTFDYFLSTSTDAMTTLLFLPLVNTDCDLGPGHSETCSDVAATISGRQRSADDALKVGELFKSGSCLAVLEKRTPPDGLFVSDADNQPVGGGQPITARFRVVRAGEIYVTPNSEINPSGSGQPQYPSPVNIVYSWDWTLVDPGPRYATGTSRPHLHRCAIADFTLTKPARILEIGIRSTLGIRGSGFTNLRQAPTLRQINALAGGELEGLVLPAAQRLQVSTFQSGSRSFSEERYAFLRISYRAEGSSSFVELPSIYGVRGLTQQAQTNGFQMELPDNARCAQIRLEPLSGWEIRSGIASGLLAVLDSRMTTSHTVFDGACIVRYVGEAPFSRSQERFGLNSIEPDGKIDLGLGYSDGDALTDLWGKLAEAFVYDEIQTTAGQGPEHEIVFVNLVESNATTPSFDRIAAVGMNIRAALEFQSVNQLSAQVIGGHIAPRYIEASNGPTHLLPDIFARLALSSKFGAGQDVTSEQINAASFLQSAQWCFARRYFFDGTLPQPQNLRQWAADQAGLHLLAFYELNGQFYFKPALTFDPVSIVDLFTAANIQKGSFQSTTSDDDQRLPIQVSGLYREERSNDDILTPGVFSTVREITIREASASDSDPVEPLDMKMSCTNRWHLIDAAKYLIRWRRLVGDPISFETTYSGLLRPIAPEDHIAVAYDEALNDLYSNGAVLDDGTLVASEPLQDGSYEVLAWDGTTPPGPTLQTLEVSSGGRQGNLLGSVWTRTAPPQVRTYRVMRVAPTDDGRLRIEAVLMPTDETGRLLLCQDWDEPSAWVIRG